MTFSLDGLSVWGLGQRRDVMDDTPVVAIGRPDVAAGLATVVVHVGEFTGVVKQSRRGLVARRAGRNGHFTEP